MTDTSVYVIDGEFKLVYINQQLKRFLPQAKVGEYCYSSLCGSDAICSRCPMIHGNDRSTVMLNPILQTWVHVDVSEVEWPGVGPCSLVMASALKQNNKNIMLNLLHFSAYDELFTIDLAQDYVRNMIHAENKYSLPPREVGYSASIDFSVQTIIHPEDAERYRAFMNPSTLAERLQSNQEHVLKAAFRKKKESGLWGWCGYTIMPDQQQITGKNRILCLIADIDSIQHGNVSGCTDSGLAALASYTQVFQNQLAQDQRILQDVERAIEAGQITFYLQPQYRMIDRKMIGAEALVRWIRSDGTLVGPDRFIPALEKSGGIVKLDCHVWEMVCAFIGELKQQGIRPLPISLNVSQIDVASMDVPAYMLSLVQKYDIDPQLLKIEITETAYARHLERINDMIFRLHEAGFQVLMDDFGSGYSSLNILKDLTFDAIKLDIRFLDIHSGNGNRGISIIESVTRMADSMGIQIIAEGIEEQMQVDYLQTLGCMYAQGYFYQRPVPKAEYIRMLRDTRYISYDGLQERQAAISAVTSSLNENIRLNDKLLTTLRLAHLNSWEWNLRKHELRLINVADHEALERLSTKLVGEQITLGNFPQLLLNSPLLDETAVAMVKEYQQWIFHAADRQELTFRIPFRNREGGQLWLQCNGVVIHDSHGQPERAFGFYTDISSQLSQARDGRFFDILSMEKEKQHYLTMISGLTAEYANVLYVDLHADTYTFFRVNERLDKVFGRRLEEISSYREIISFYINHLVYAEDQYLLDCIKDPALLSQRLKENNCFSIHYRTLWQGRMLYCDMRVAAGDKACSEIVIGIRNMDDDYRRLRLMEKTKRTDSITGLMNRPSFEAAVSRELYDRDRDDSALLLIDIDFFKRINDLYSRKVGDRILNAVADKLQSIFRRSDIIGRFGGDEFGIFLKNIPWQVLVQKVTQCLQELQRIGIEEVENINLTVSLGVVYCYGGFSDDDGSQLMEMADTALNESKHRGRNCYTVKFLGRPEMTIE